MFRWVTIAIILVLATVLSATAHKSEKLRRLLDRRLAASQAELQLLAEHSQDLVERLDSSGVRRYVSPSATTVVGKPPADLVGTSFFESVHQEDRDRVVAAIRKLMEASATETVEFRNASSATGAAWLETKFNILPAGGDGTRSLVAITRDITQRKASELRLSELATLDPLTGLANRRKFDEQFGIEVNLCRQGAQSAGVAIVLLDVDRFKLYNDRYGHLEGDRCLKAVADVLKQCAGRPRDLVARFGGEEFVALLPATDLSGAMEVAERMRAAVQALGLPHEGNSPSRKVTVSAGVADLAMIASLKDCDAAEVLSLADEGLYAAKRTGRNRVRAVNSTIAKTA